MLTIFRRHTKDCKFTGRKHRNCQCPIAVEGTLHGRMIRKSLDLRSWEAAQKLVRDWEANPEGGGITVKVAVEKYLSDAKARNISDSQMRKVRLELGEVERNFSSVAIRSVSVDDLRDLPPNFSPGIMRHSPEFAQQRNGVAACDYCQEPTCSDEIVRLA
jgi:hypothetical protein